jgi:hypothetical protein
LSTKVNLRCLRPIDQLPWYFQENYKIRPTAFYVAFFRKQIAINNHAVCEVENDGALLFLFGQK